MVLTELVTLSLATHRGTRLVIEDEISAPVRELIISSLDGYPAIQDKVQYLLSCPWCTSIHVATALLVLRKIHRPTYIFLSSLLAASSVTGLISTNL